ncbi:PAP2 superfamily protein [Stackebrandtia albiflava]|uniref:PAP2 superfamily protein n=2 Tax=Stackebrandtia albiflava TaxID=406432 RepID=A0A562VD82_9ACTN|nr:PAP2 superfamily protein [Stackebrandtia albiflava]
MVTALLAITALLWWPSPLVVLDVVIRDHVEADQPGWALEIAAVFKFLGLPTLQAIVCTYLALCCARHHRSIRPLLPVGATWLLMAGTKELQRLSDRVFPHWPDCPPRCPDTDTGPEGAAFFAGQGFDAFPSGHSIATATWFGLAVWLLPRLGVAWRWALAVTPSVLLTAGQTYLGYHWATDSVGGILLGVLLSRTVRRFPWDTVPLGPLDLLERHIPGGPGRRGQSAHRSFSRTSVSAARRLSASASLPSTTAPIRNRPEVSEP